MRVAIVNRHREDGLGGSEIQCDIIARGLAQRNIPVVYVAVNGSGRYPNVPYEVVPVPEDGPAIVAACLERRPTIVYWRFGKTCLRYVSKRIRRAEVAFVFSVSCITDISVVPPWERLKGYSGPYGALKRLVRSTWNHGGFKSLSGLVSLNPDYVGMLDTPRQIFIPNSMPSEAVSFRWPRPYVAWVANIKAHKRPEVCLELARALAPRGVDVLMIGEIQQESYRWLRNAAALPANLHYLGPKTVEEVNGVLAGAVALAHTCTPEGFGNNFIQAWLQRRPVVSLEFDPGGLIEKHGLGYVSHGDIARFCEDVLTIVDDSAAARRIGDNARKWAASHCESGRNVGRLVEFLQEIGASP